jgi:hypothetical protein
MNNRFSGESITESDRDILTEAAFAMQSAYRTEKTWYDAIHKVKKLCPKVTLWEIEGMWRAIDAYVDVNILSEEYLNEEGGEENQILI